MPRKPRPELSSGRRSSSSSYRPQAITFNDRASIIPCLSSLSKRRGQAITAAHQLDPVLPVPKRNTVFTIRQILDLLSVQFPVMGGNGNESDGRGAGNDAFSDPRAGLELRQHRTEPDAAALEFQRNHPQPCGSIVLPDEQVIAPLGIPSGRRSAVVHIDQTRRIRRAFQLYGASLFVACFRKTSRIDDFVDVLQRRRHWLRPSSIRLEIFAQSL